MQQYIVRRLLAVIPMLLGVSVMIFALVRIIPGDVALLMVTGGQEAPSSLDRQAVVEEIRHQLDLDKPIVVQYGIWLSKAVQGDLGVSYWTRRPILDEIVQTFPVTMELALLSLAVALLIGIPVGVVSAVRQDSIPDYAGRFLSIGALSIPEFWVGTMMILLPLLWWGWIPSIKYTPLWVDPMANLGQLIFPAVAIGVNGAGPIMRLIRSSMLEVVRQDYIRTAWAKGLRERSVLVHHALKNAAIPVLSLIGVRLERLLGGTVVLESIFTIPGMGRLALGAISERDYPMVQAVIVTFAAIAIFINLATDLLYAWLDPRIRYQ